MINKSIHVVMPFLALLVVASAVLSYTDTGISGELVSSTWATETGTLEKEVNQEVYFKAKVKNTGTLEATFVVEAFYKEHGTDDWLLLGQREVILSSGQYSEVLIVGTVNSTELMEGKYFDAKFILYEDGKEQILDEEHVPEAWYVESAILQGRI